MTNFFTISLMLVLLLGCGQVSQITISEAEYKQTLGKVVCKVVKNLNEQGVLESAEEIEKKFDPLIQEAVKELGYSAKAWLAAKEKYFPEEEEHTKLVKMHFTWCLIGDSISE